MLSQNIAVVFFTSDIGLMSPLKVATLICAVKEKICCLYDYHHQKLYFQYLMCLKPVQKIKWGISWSFLHLCLWIFYIYLISYLSPLINRLYFLCRKNKPIQKEDLLWEISQQTGMYIFSSSFFKPLDSLEDGYWINKACTLGIKS